MSVSKCLILYFVNSLVKLSGDANKSFFFNILGVTTIGNKIYVLSGHDGENSFFSSIEVYDTETSRWSELPILTLPYGRCRFTCVAMDTKQAWPRIGLIVHMYMQKSRAFCYIMYCVNYLLLIGIFYKLLFWCKNNAKMSIICKYNWKIAQCDSEIFDLVILYWACDNRMFCAICLFDIMCSSRS